MCVESRGQVGGRRGGRAGRGRSHRSDGCRRAPPARGQGEQQAEEKRKCTLTECSSARSARKTAALHASAPSSTRTRMRTHVRLELSLRLGAASEHLWRRSDKRGRRRRRRSGAPFMGRSGDSPNGSAAGHRCARALAHGVSWERVDNEGCSATLQCAIYKGQSSEGRGERQETRRLRGWGGRPLPSPSTNKATHRDTGVQGTLLVQDIVGRERRGKASSGERERAEDRAAGTASPTGPTITPFDRPTRTGKEHLQPRT